MFDIMAKSSIPETCRKCRAFCCKLGSVTVTAEERKRILGAGHSDCFVKVGSGRYDIKSGPDGRCAYLKDDNFVAFMKNGLPFAGSGRLTLS